MRINKFIAKSGVASRRGAEKLILNGEIIINDKVVDDLSYIVDEINDVVKYNNKTISVIEKKVYILLHKPEGYITTSKEQFNRPKVLDLLKDVKERVYPVGRLDYETSGFLILTNDGDLTYKLTHPKHEVEKTYIASVKGLLLSTEIEKFESGLEIEDYKTAPAKLKVIKSDPIKNYSVCAVKIHEGKNRQVRKMFAEINHPVLNLKRVGMGTLKLDKLEKGCYRYLTEEEVKGLL